MNITSRTVCAHAVNLCMACAWLLVSQPFSAMTLVITYGQFAHMALIPVWLLDALKRQVFLGAKNLEGQNPVSAVPLPGQ